MLSAAEIRARVTREPFIPLRLIVEDGRSYEIPSRDMVMVTTGFVSVGTPWKRNPGIAESVDRVAIQNIVAMEDVLRVD